VALVPVRPVWTLALNNQLTVAPAYDATRVYFAIEHERLVAYDTLAGTQRWLIDARPLFPPATGDDRVFIVESDGLKALDANDGSVAWQVAIKDVVAARPVWDNGWLIVALRNGTVLAFRASDGHLVWEHDVGAPAHAPAALAADRVYVPTANGRIVALQVANGAPVWETRIGGAANEMVAAGARLFFGSSDNYFYCVLMKDGRIDWRWRTGGDVTGRPAIDERRVYFTSFDNVLRALDRTSGGQAWMRALPGRPLGGPAVAGATIVVATLTPPVKAFNVKDGAPSADIAAAGEMAAAPHTLAHPGTGLPMILLITRDIAKGAGAALSVRSIEPLPTPIVPLPSPVLPPPTLAIPR